MIISKSFRALWRPAESKSVEDITARERTIIRAMGFCWLACIVTMKLSVGVGNNIEFPFVLVTIFTGWLLLSKNAVISLSGVLFYFSFFALALIWQIISPANGDPNIFAVSYLALIYVPFLLDVKIGEAAYHRFLKYFQLVGAFIAGMVFLGWAMQFAGLHILDMENYIPVSMKFINYNYVQPIHWGSPFTKPNGFFMLETSHTSQLLAICLLVEICVLGRLIFTLYFATALLSTFGGTGMLLVLLSLPVLLFYLKPKTILFGLLAAPLLFLAANRIGLTSNVDNRSGEFATQGTSGYGRFIQPYLVVAQTVEAGTTKAFFGQGAGNLPSVGGHELYVVNPITKMLAEYGVVLGTLWLLWFHGRVFTRGVPTIVTVAALLQYDFMNGSLLVPINAYYVLFLSSLIIVPKRQIAASTQVIARPNLATLRARAGSFLGGKAGAT